MLKKIIIISQFVSLSAAFATDVPIIDHPTYSGSGCRAGTVQVAASSDSQTISILFDEFRADAGGSAAIGTKFCEIKIPLKIASDRKLMIHQADYRGFNSLTANSSSELSVEYGFGQRPGQGHSRTRKFKGPLQEDYLDTVREESKVNCGEPLLLTVKIQLKVNANSGREGVFSVLDSADSAPLPTRPNGRRGLSYSFKVKKCNEP